MKIVGMIAACGRALDNAAVSGGKVSFVIKGSWPARGNRKRLCGKYGGPLGECVSELECEVLVVFDAKESLVYLVNLLKQAQADMVPNRKASKSVDAVLSL